MNLYAIQYYGVIVIMGKYNIYLQIIYINCKKINTFFTKVFLLSYNEYKIYEWSFIYKIYINI